MIHMYLQHLFAVTRVRCHKRTFGFPMHPVRCCDLVQAILGARITTQPTQPVGPVVTHTHTHTHTHTR